MSIHTPTDQEFPPEAANAFAQGASAWVSSGTAHAGLWTDGVPEMAGQTVGTIGAFAAESSKDAAAVLEEAENFLSDHGITRILGPMNGNTWRYHRLVIESTGRQPFLYEPRNPPDYVEHFKDAGYEELSRYSSASIDLAVPAPDLSRLEQSLAKSQVTIRDLIPEQFESDLEAIFEVSLVSFSHNYLYTPLSKEHFLALYTKAREHIVPEFVKLAEQDGKVVGFVFALPDLKAAQRGEKPAVIVKTLAVLPERRLAGLGTVLVDRAQQAAKARGFTEAIHALQHENNTSHRISQRFEATIFRRYALFSKALA